MANYAILTAMGKDQPGIVAGISGVLLEKDCNIEDSTMARLGGEFTVMLLLRLPEGLTARQVDQELGVLRGKMRLTAQLTDLRPEDAMEVPEVPRHVVRVYGADKKGIVAKITRLLADRSVNITNLNTHVLRHAQPLYIMSIEVEIPPFVEPEVLSRELAEAGKEIAVQVSMRPKDEGSHQEV